MEVSLQTVQRPLTKNTHPLPQQWPNCTCTTSSSLSMNPTRNHSPFRLLRLVRTRYRRWDSNAETFRAQNFNFNPQNDDEDDDEDTDEWLGVLEELIDGAWIFPVFRSFGWMLPPIISSFLLTSGLKAFLLALAIPLGQSAFSLAFQSIKGRKPSKRKRKAKAKKNPQARTPRNVKVDEEEAAAAENEGVRKGRMGYQTWVAGNDVRVNKDTTQDSSSFGGWDELDRRTTKFDKESASKSTRNAGGPRRSKLSRREGKSGTPLLLRLLIAVFPFLGSWTRML